MTEQPSRLPSFDELKIMALEHPQELENLRKRLIAELIASAPECRRRRLEGLAFVIEAERRKARNPMQACIRLSKMMLDSLVELNTSLNLSGPSTPTEQHPTATVLPFDRSRGSLQ